MSERPEGKVSPQEAAAILGCHFHTVYRRIRKGLYPAKETLDGRQWLDPEEIQRISRPKPVNRR